MDRRSPEICVSEELGVVRGEKKSGQIPGNFSSENSFRDGNTWATSKATSFQRDQ
jgi:hypothetical protein